MDTLQVTAELLPIVHACCFSNPRGARPGVRRRLVGAGIRTPTAAECLRAVPMSQPDTGESSFEGRRANNGIDVTLVQRLATSTSWIDIALVRDCRAPGVGGSRAYRGWTLRPRRRICLPVGEGYDVGQQ